MKEIKTHKGISFFVDNKDYEFVDQWLWTLSEHGYIVRHSNIWDNLPKSTIIYLHKILTFGPDEYHVDHWDGNKLNNQKDNLRVCTPSQNIANSKPTKGKKYKGISKSFGKYRARIKVNYKEIHLGTFDTEEKAALAYNVAAEKYFDKYARLNPV